MMNKNQKKAFERGRQAYRNGEPRNDRKSEFWKDGWYYEGRLATERNSSKWLERTARQVGL